LTNQLDCLAIGVFYQAGNMYVQRCYGTVILIKTMKQMLYCKLKV